jgi:hypothetical protein
MAVPQVARFVNDAGRGERMISRLTKWQWIAY